MGADDSRLPRRGRRPVLVETGSQSSIAVLLAALDELGMGPDDLAGVAVTHIHLDHAGGVGDVARRSRRRRSTCTRRARAPRRPRAARALGGDGLRRPLLDSLYGRLEPTAPERASTCSRTARRSVVSPARCAHDRRLARPRQAPPRAARLDRAGSCSSGTQWACGCPTPASCVRPRPRPTSTSTWRSARCTSSSIATLPRSRSRTTASCRTRSTRCERPRASCASGPRSPRRRFERINDIAEALDAAFSGAARRHRPRAPREARDALNGVHSNAAGFRTLARATAGARARPLPLGRLARATRRARRSRRRGRRRARGSSAPAARSGAIAEAALSGEASSILTKRLLEARQRVRVAARRSDFCTVLEAAGRGSRPPSVYFVALRAAAPTSRNTSSDGLLDHDSVERLADDTEHREQGERRAEDDLVAQGVVDDQTGRTRR